jgi:hypothetical protein
MHHSDKRYEIRDKNCLKIQIDAEFRLLVFEITLKIYVISKTSKTKMFRNFIRFPTVYHLFKSDKGFKNIIKT